MATKSLTVTEDAYKALKALKRDSESFSQVILRMSKKENRLSKYLGILEDSNRSADDMISEISKGRDNSEREVWKKYGDS